MASATFRLTQPSSSPPPPPHYSKPKPTIITTTTFPFKPYPTFHKLQLTVKSTEVSKEDRPFLDPEPTSQEPLPTDLPDLTDLTDITDTSFDQRRLEEKFAVLNTGIYECRSCGYLCNEAAGDPSYPIAPGLPFEQFPEDWRCPTCGAAKSFFGSKSVEIAGFAQNQQFGLGGNTLTSGQKAIVIYGSLLFFFVLFLSGYFLQ